MKVKVLFFAQLRDQFGMNETIVELPEGIFVKDMVPYVGNSLASSLRFAVNENFVEPEHELNDGDTVALMTPVSGG